MVVDLRLPNGMNPSRLIRAVRALLDFLHLAQYPVQSTATLDLFTDSLTRFHENKDIFVDLGVREHFNFMSTLWYHGQLQHRIYRTVTY